MYLHLGQDYIVPLQSVVAVFDMDTATASKRTRLLLERLQDEGRIIELYDDLPRAAVLCESALGFLRRPFSAAQRKVMLSKKFENCEWKIENVAILAR